jgi:hypothetical protein
MAKSENGTRKMALMKFLFGAGSVGVVCVLILSGVSPETIKMGTIVMMGLMVVGIVLWYFLKIKPAMRRMADEQIRQAMREQDD